jgi:hypothetical protein
MRRKTNQISNGVKSKTDKILEIIAVLVLTGLLFEGIYLYYHWPKGDELYSFSDTKTYLVGKENPTIEKSSVDKIQIEKAPPLPENVNLEIPFTSQAPFGDWSYPFNYTCEEAAVLMAHYYIEGKTSIDPAQAREELLDLVEYEKKNYGFHEDTNTAQTAQLIKDYYGHSVKVEYDISLEDIKKELAKGNPVIVPTAGRLLDNPYFKPPGPLYHMLLIKGYSTTSTTTDFIVHDPGTKRGADFVYSYQTLEKSIHDLEGKDLENIASGRSAMISILKK